MKKKLIVIQEEISDCGVCSLLSIIRYYNGNASLEDLRINSLTTNDGVTAYNLIECAKKYGFDAIGYKVDELERNHLPYIAHFKINKSLSHFVVVYKIKDNVVTIMDPAKGLVKMSINEFDSYFTGVVISLFPKAQIINYQSKNFLMKYSLNTIKNNKKDLSIIIIENLFILFLTLLISFFIEIFNIFEYSLILVFVFIFLIIIKNLITLKVRRKEIKYNNNIKKELFTNYFIHLFKLPLKYIHLKDSGELIKRADDLDVASNIIFTSLTSIIFNTIIILVILSIIFMILPNIIIYLIAFVFISILYVILTNKKVLKKTRNVLEKQNNYNSNLIDIISGLTSIKHSYNNNFYSKINKEFNINIETYENYINYLCHQDFITNSLIGILELIINTYLILSINNNIIKVEQFIVISILSNIFITSAIEIQKQIPNLLFLKSIKNRINNYFAIEEESYDGIITNDTTIEISNLNFGYNKFNKVLNNINIRINPGEKVIIKGESGTGKSTICKILIKEHKYSDGSIKIGEKELNNISLKWINKIISYSSQSEKIFKGTIRENILLGRNVDDTDFNKICEICCLDRIVNKRPFKYDTFLFGGGEELSGGERQLIILARTLLKSSKIIILDETLSEVNDKVEDEILNNIFNYYVDNTIIYVSHKNKKNYFKRTIKV